MMPGYIETFTRCVHFKQSLADARWKAAYSSGSPAVFAGIRRAKITAIYQTLYKNQRGIRTCWERLIKAVGFDPFLTSIQPAVACLGLAAGNTFLDALLWCVVRYADWIRPIEEWYAQTDDPHALMSSLIHHLFLNYPLPQFLLSAWYEGFNETAWEHQNWALHIGRGGSLQTLSLPVALTHRAAHLFLQTSTHRTIAYGLRHAQVTAMGGSQALAELLASTLKVPEPDEEFLLPLIGLWTRQPVTDPQTVQNIIEYARFQKIQREQEGGKFIFKGRTTAALKREAEEWKTRQDKQISATQWKHLEMPPLVREVEYEEGKHAVWTVDELTTKRELYAEGRGMRNCVYDYLEGCLRGITSIWSVRFRRTDGSKLRRIMTVQFTPETREIVQIGVFANGEIKPENRMHAFALSLLKEWAEAQELKFTYTLETD